MAPSSSGQVPPVAWSQNVYLLCRPGRSLTSPLPTLALQHSPLGPARKEKEALLSNRRAGLLCSSRCTTCGYNEQVRMSVLVESCIPCKAPQSALPTVLREKSGPGPRTAVCLLSLLSQSESVLVSVPVRCAGSPNHTEPPHLCT